jgi:hypothetical protein
LPDAPGLGNARLTGPELLSEKHSAVFLTERATTMVFPHFVGYASLSPTGFAEARDY